MMEPKIAKITVNIGAGEGGEKLARAEALIQKMTNTKPVRTVAKITEPAFGIRKNQQLGVKTTLRGKEAEAFLKNALGAVDNNIKESSITSNGFSFGIKESIDMPGLKYDPKVGVFGFDVCVAIERKGYRIKRRAKMASKIGKNHLLTKEAVIKYAKEKLGVNVVGDA